MSTHPLGVASPLICQSTLWVLRACEWYPVIASEARIICHCEPAKQSLFSICWLWKGEIAMSLYPVIASLRSNLSFIRLLAVNNRDRHVPRDDMKG